MQVQNLHCSPSYSLDPDNSLLRSSLPKVIDSETYREGMLYLCQRIGQQSVHCWLHHSSRHYLPTISDQVWMVEVLYPLLARTELRRMAIVVSEDLFLQTILEQLCSRSEPIFHGSIRMRTFHDAQSAEDWLLARG